MSYRYCPECDRWLETSEYTVDDHGETVCPDHRATHGFINRAPWTEKMFFHEHPEWYDDRHEMLAAAKRQGLVR